MDTGSSFLGGGFGSSFAPPNGYSSGLLNQPGGFGQRNSPFVADSGLGQGLRNAYDMQGAQQQFGFTGDLQRAQNAAETQRATIAARAETLPARLAQQRFHTVFPLIQNALKGFGSNPYSVGGGTPPQPAINAGPVWTPQQTQAQVNAQTAQDDQRTAGQIRGIQQQAAGRGFGANSPLAQALAGQATAANNANNAQTAQQTYFGTAESNAKQQLAGQQAQEGQWTDLQNAQVERAKPYFGLYNTLLGSLSSFGR